MSLKENLENFLETYENMTDMSSSLDGSDSFEMEFTHLKQISQRYRTEKVYPTAAGETEINMRKNRYKDILPFDHSRFTLTQIDNQECSDYINANYLKGASSDYSYLAAQGPLPHTVNDFWRMLWESNTQIIIMACNEFEQGRHKCERYWVDEGEEHVFGDILVTQIRQQRVTKDFMIRTLKATRDKEEKIFNQFHYTAWPDHGVPTSVRPILEMIKLVREYQPEEEPSIVVHCSAGCGRTGTICVIDYVRNALQQEKIDQNFSLYDIIVEMRKQRHAIVQTRNQYELVHRAVVNMFQVHLGINPDFGHNYENVQLRHDHFEQPRMPPTPRVPGQSGSGDKRDSQSHNYVNCNITPKGVSMDSEPPMPKLPSAPSKPSRSSDSPDGTVYANCDVGASPGDQSKPTQDTSSSHTNKQTPVAKSRQSPDDRYKNNFKATLSAFKDIEFDCATPPTQITVTSPVTTPTSQPLAQPRNKPSQAAKPVALAKPQIAGKPKTKPSPPVKPATMDSTGKPVGEKVGNGEVMSAGKMFATRQNSNPLSSKMPTKEASPPSARSAEKKEALKLPGKLRQLEKSKSENGEGLVSPGVRHGGALKPAFKGPKGDRPSQPPPRPPPNTKPTLQKSNTEERASVKGRHDYEEVHISPPPDKGKDTAELLGGKNFRGSPTQQIDSFDPKDSGIVRRKTSSDTTRKHSNGSVQSLNASDTKPVRKSSESFEYAYVSQPSSIADMLMKSEDNAPKKSTSAMYAQAYAEVAPDSNSPSPARRSSGSVKEYSYVDTKKMVPPEKPKRGESYSGGDGDSTYDLVGIPGSDSSFDSFADSEGNYNMTGETFDAVGSDAPVVPARTAQSYQLVDEEDKDEKTPTGGKINKVKAKFANSRDLLGQHQGKLVNNTKGLFKRIGVALKPETSGSHGNIQPPDTDSAKHSNINELLEKTLKDYQPTYKEGTVMYKEQEIGFPKRVAGPRRPRSPPSSWGVRSAQVHL